jgi:hypothetical protein
MIGFLLLPLLGALLALIVKRGGDRDPGNRLLKLMLAGYAARMILQLFLRDLPVFSHGSGGDYVIYEIQAADIIRYWDIHGVWYVTDADFPGLGATALPPNLFAFIDLLSGGPSRVGCTSVVAFLSCLACLELYRLAVGVGADPKKSYWVVAIILFSPAYLFYTSEMFKDGIVAFLVVAAIGASFRLAHKVSIGTLLAVSAYLFLLWGVRFYLVFLAAVPLAIGFVGTGSKSVLRPIVTLLVVAGAAVALARASSAFSSVATRMNDTYEHATSEAVVQWNATNSGSAVEFNDGGNPLGRLWLKTIYTVLSPFPWQLGSIALHVGKIDAGIFAYFIYRAIRACRDLMKRDRTLMLMFVSVIIPLTLAYATTMSNIGLIVRQRIPIVMITGALATLSWPRPQQGGAPFATVRQSLRALAARRRRPIPRLRPLPIPVGARPRRLPAASRGVS